MCPQGFHPADETVVLPSKSSSSSSSCFPVRPVAHGCPQLMEALRPFRLFSCSAPKGSLHFFCYGSLWSSGEALSLLIRILSVFLK